MQRQVQYRNVTLDPVIIANHYFRQCRRNGKSCLHTSFARLLVRKNAVVYIVIVRVILWRSQFHYDINRDRTIEAGFIPNPYIEDNWCSSCETVPGQLEQHTSFVYSRDTSQYKLFLLYKII